MQQTIKRPISFEGVGLHTGTYSKIILKPFPENTGINFCINNQHGKTSFKLSPDYIVSTRYCLSAGFGKVIVRTIEHLLSAIIGLEIDNILIIVHGNEIPIFDGSAMPFINFLKFVGIEQQNIKRNKYIISDNIEIYQGYSFIKATPSDILSINYQISFEHPLIKEQQFYFEFSTENFINEICSARTFGFIKDEKDLKANGFALGWSLENIIALDDTTILNQEGLRYSNEFVRHKILDFLGDIYVTGIQLIGKYDVFASGHTLDLEFVRRVKTLANNFQ